MCVCVYCNGACGNKETGACGEKKNWCEKNVQVQDFEDYAISAGFSQPRVLSLAPIEIYDCSLKTLVGPHPQKSYI